MVQQILYIIRILYILQYIIVANKSKPKWRLVGCDFCFKTLTCDWRGSGVSCCRLVCEFNSVRRCDITDAGFRRQVRRWQMGAVSGGRSTGAHRAAQSVRYRREHSWETGGAGQELFSCPCSRPRVPCRAPRTGLLWVDGARNREQRRDRSSSDRRVAGQDPQAVANAHLPPLKRALQTHLFLVELSEVVDNNRNWQRDHCELWLL